MSVLTRRPVASSMIAGVLVLSVMGNAAAFGAAKGSSPKAPSKARARTTKKAVNRSAQRSTNTATASAAPPTSTVPARRSAGTPIEGWDRISQTEWPTLSGGIVAIPAKDFLIAYRTPNDPKYAFRIEAGRTVFGAVRLLALGYRGEWVKVGLPIRPNGTVGWVHRSDIQLARAAAHIQIELATNTMRVFENGELKVQTKVAAGTGNTPTPTGLFFVKELVPQRNPSGALGPYAFGLSGFSNVLYSFAGGQGVVAIHGTNAPGKLGADVSHGCVRVANQNIIAMTKLVALGTPVEIVNSWDDLPKQRVSTDWVAAASEPAPALVSESGSSPDNDPHSAPTTATPAGTGASPEPVAVANTAVTVVSHDLAS